MILLALFLACANPAENKTSAEIVAPAAPAAPEAPAAPTAPAAPAGPEKALTGSIGFTGAKVTRSHDGVFNTWTGAGSVVEGKLQAVRFEVEIASLVTDSPKLDDLSLIHI